MKLKYKNDGTYDLKGLNLEQVNMIYTYLSITRLGVGYSDDLFEFLSAFNGAEMDDSPVEFQISFSESEGAVIEFIE